MNRFLPIYNNGVRPGKSQAEIRAELQWYKDNGYGGFGVNGCTSKPLADVHDWLPEYMKTVRQYCDIAHELGLDMWIFDEWGYPSGCACGLVLTPENRAKKLQLTYDLLLEVGESVSLPLPPRTLAVGAIPVNRFAPYHPAGRAVLLDPRDGMIHYTAIARTRLVVVTYESHSFVTHVMKQYEEGDPTIGTVDIIDAATVRKFLDNMHERYVPVIGDEFGKTVRGFFYDEPEICWDFPYTPTLDAWFEKRHGYPMKQILPEMLAYMPGHCGVTDGDSYWRMRDEFNDYTDSWTSLLAESFYGQIQTWCHEHNLESVGHQDLDHMPETLVTVSGDFYRNSMRNDRPGVDVICHNIIQNRFCDFPRYAGSVAHLHGKNGAMSETFAVMGDAIPPDCMRYLMEEQVVRGIDTFFLYTQYGPNNHRDPNVQAYTGYVMRRIRETAATLQGSLADLVLVVPLREIASQRACLNPHMVNGFPLPWERLEETAKALCYAPIDFEYAYEEGLAQLYEKGFRHVVLVAGITDEARAALDDFVSSGGKVYCVDQKWYGNSTYVYSPHDLLTRLPHTVTFEGRHNISMRACGTNEGTVYAFLNETDDCDTVSVRMPAGRWSEKVGDAWIETDASRLTFSPRELKLMRRFTDVDIPLGHIAETLNLSDWTFCTDGGAPVQIRALRPWEEIDPTLDGYTGFCAYTTELNWQGGIADIRLGNVGFTAEITLNGRTVCLPFSPWRARFDLPAGTYTLCVRVLNSYANRLLSDGHISCYDFYYKRSGLLSTVTIDRIV